MSDLKRQFLRRATISRATINSSRRRLQTIKLSRSVKKATSMAAMLQPNFARKHNENLGRAERARRCARACACARARAPETVESKTPTTQHDRCCAHCLASRSFELKFSGGRRNKTARGVFAPASRNIDQPHALAMTTTTTTNVARRGDGDYKRDSSRDRLLRLSEKR